MNSLSLAGATTNDNLLSGSPFEFLPYDALVEFGFAMETGGAVGDIVLDVFSGSDLVVTNFKVPNSGNIKTNESMFFDDEAAAGDRLTIRARNTTASTARVFQFLVRISPL
jgi:hypothetical protein